VRKKKVTGHFQVAAQTSFMAPEWGPQASVMPGFLIKKQWANFPIP
jgi:hypothetical protein